MGLFLRANVAYLISRFQWKLKLPRWLKRVIPDTSNRWER